MPRIHLLRVTLLLICLDSFAQVATAADWSIEPVGRFVFEEASIRELSGLSWDSTAAAAPLYFCVSDAEPVLISLHAAIDVDTGKITSVTMGEPIALTDASTDLEGIAFDAKSRSVFISNESEPGIRQHNASSGELLNRIDASSHPQLGAFQGATQNKAWESLAMSPDGRTIWTANEDSLPSDPAGTIRLQRFDAALQPTGQWAYEMSPVPEHWTSKFALGVPDLLVLPGGALVVMERGFGSIRGGVEARIQLFQIDFRDATNLAGGSLDEAARVGKSLLWESSFNDFNSNFEGLTLGPTLNNGDRSLLLVADNGGLSRRHSLFTLRLKAVPHAGVVPGQ